MSQVGHQRLSASDLGRILAGVGGNFKPALWWRRPIAHGPVGAFEISRSACSVVILWSARVASLLAPPGNDELSSALAHLSGRNRTADAQEFAVEGHLPRHPI